MNCTGCYLSHDPGVAKCPACNTPQSSTQSAPAAPSASSAAAAPSATPASVPTITASDGRSLRALLNIKSGTWTCSGCCFSHDPSVAKCPACNTPQSSTQSVPAAAAPSANPNSAPTITASDGGSLREMMNIKSSTWTCSGCYLSHDPSVAKCPACNTPQSSTQSAPAAPSAASAAAAPSATPASAPTITASDGRSLRDLLNIKAGTWTCTGCYLSHDPGVYKCPACNTPQSSSQSAPAAAAPSATPASAPTITARDDRPLRDLLNIKSGRGTCSGCYFSDDPSVAKCPACNTPQSSTQSVPAAPSAASAAAAPSANPASAPTVTASDGRSLREMMNIKSSTWTCSGCYLSHDPSVAKCPACNTPQSSTQSARAAPSATPASAPTITASDGRSLLDLLNCTCCYLSHDPSVAKCPACNTPQSSTQSAPAAPSASSAAAASSATPASVPTITASDCRSLRALLNIKSGTWTCSGCCFTHDPSIAKCPACNTPQSSTQSVPAAPSAASAAAAPSATRFCSNHNCQ
ncbi:E3 SUMO-protein ligase RanBP2-like [Sycon ciliatum]|uniref:E3 SUMO-protein ligase RanBP2-like n=1 Tax=Sycon ciliatum TaxID=27933 RepID=UPI0031F67767